MAEALKRSATKAMGVAGVEGGAVAKSQNQKKKSAQEFKEDLIVATAMLAVGLETRVRVLESCVLETTQLLVENKYPVAITKMNHDYTGIVAAAKSKEARAEIFSCGRCFYAFAECLKLVIPSLEAEQADPAVKDALVFAQQMSENPINLEGIVKHFQRFRPNKEGRCKILAHLESVHAVVCWRFMKKDIHNSDPLSKTFNGTAPKSPAARKVTAALIGLGHWKKLEAGM